MLSLSKYCDTMYGAGLHIDENDEGAASSWQVDEMRFILVILGLSCVAAEMSDDPRVELSVEADSAKHCVNIDIMQCVSAYAILRNSLWDEQVKESLDCDFAHLTTESALADAKSADAKSADTESDVEVVWHQRVAIQEIDDFLRTAESKVGKRSMGFFGVAVSLLPFVGSGNVVDLREDSLYRKLVVGEDVLSRFDEIINSSGGVKITLEAERVSEAYARYLSTNFGEEYLFEKLELIPDMELIGMPTRGAINSFIWGALIAKGVQSVRSLLSYLKCVLLRPSFVWNPSDKEIDRICECLIRLGKKKVGRDFLEFGQDVMATPSVASRGFWQYAQNRLQPSLWDCVVDGLPGHGYLKGPAKQDPDEETAYAYLWSVEEPSVGEVGGDAAIVSTPIRDDNLVLCDVIQMNMAYNALMQKCSEHVDSTKFVFLKKALYIDEDILVNAPGVCFKKMSAIKIDEFIMLLSDRFPERPAAFWNFVVRCLPGGDAPFQTDWCHRLPSGSLLKELVDGNNVLSLVHTMLLAGKKETKGTAKEQSAAMYLKYLSPRFPEQCWFRLLERDLDVKARDVTPHLLWDVLKAKGVSDVSCLLSYLKHVILHPTLDAVESKNEILQTLGCLYSLGKKAVAREFLGVGVTYFERLVENNPSMFEKDASIVENDKPEFDDLFSLGAGSLDFEEDSLPAPPSLANRLLKGVSLKRLINDRFAVAFKSVAPSPWDLVQRVLSPEVEDYGYLWGLKC